MADRLPILIVDDDAQMLRTIGDILRARGYDPIPARSGQEAIEAAEARPPAMALVDLKLPDMDGIDVVSRVRGVAPLVEIIIFTGNASVESAVRALREQSYDYLLKPVAPEELLTCIARAGDRWRRRRAEAALEESEIRLRRMFESVSDSVFITDGDGAIIDANPAATTLLGSSIETFRGERIEALLAPSLESLDVRVSAFAPGLYVHSVRDLTEQRRLEAALRHGQKMEAIGRLASGVAHDFNNMLTVIISLGSLLKETHPKTNPDREMLDDIVEAAQRGAALTRQLLACSRKQVMRPRVMDVNATINGLRAILARLVGDGISVSLDLDDSVDLIFADPGQIEQVLMNLAVNARDAMPDGGTFTIASSNVESAGDQSAASHVVLSVSDSGQGIPADVVDHIFEPFFTTKEEGSGTGLGLAMVHGIVEQSGGFIRVHSELEKGTTFWIHLPREEGAARGSLATSGK
ncbi:MAG: hybrid sensor histidine kinase/response regulator [Gemmatimonadetes bacterium]|nr:hybrid sensor histidine kinase/response regulator [Gemmatimonadota bacterium]